MTTIGQKGVRVCGRGSFCDSERFIQVGIFQFEAFVLPVISLRSFRVIKMKQSVPKYTKNGINCRKVRAFHEDSARLFHVFICCKWIRMVMERKEAVCVCVG